MKIRLFSQLLQDFVIQCCEDCVTNRVTGNPVTDTEMMMKIKWVTNLITIIIIHILGPSSFPLPCLIEKYQMISRRKVFTRFIKHEIPSKCNRSQEENSLVPPNQWLGRLDELSHRRKNRLICLAYSPKVLHPDWQLYLEWPFRLEL